MSDYAKRRKFHSEKVSRYKALLLLRCRGLDFSKANNVCSLPADFPKMVQVCMDCIQVSRQLYIKRGGHLFAAEAKKVSVPLKFKEEYEEQKL